MDLSLIYRALAEGQLDVIAGDATSALIDQFHLTALEDTRAYFPPYDAVPIVRTATLLRQPAVGRALTAMAGSVSAADMRALNAAVDIEHRDVAQTVREFLARSQTIKLSLQQWLPIAMPGLSDSITKAERHEGPLATICSVISCFRRHDEPS